jgi:hypothetical protein
MLRLHSLTVQDVERTLASVMCVLYLLGTQACAALILTMIAVPWMVSMLGCHAAQHGPCLNASGLGTTTPELCRPKASC